MRLAVSKNDERALRRRSVRLEAQVEELTREVCELASKIARAEQVERHRISEILHDDLQQRIYGIGLHVALARQDVTEGKQANVLKDLARIETWLGESLEILHELTVDLSPPGLKSDALASVLSHLTAQMNELHGLKVELYANRSLETPPEMRALLYQIVRELLFNVVKHSGARHAAVTVRRETDQVNVRVADEGTGFDPNATFTRRGTGGGFGLVNLRERLRAMGGTMAIDSAPGRGTRITVSVPIER